MVKRRVANAVVSSVALLGAFAPLVADARGPLLAERKIAQWGGPELRTRCIGKWSMHVPSCKWLKCKRKKISGCKEWATDFKQHRMFARMYGPDSITNADEQLKKIADACLASGLVLAGLPAVAASVVDLDVEVFQKGVEACLETQNVLSQVVAPGFEVTTETTESWG